MIAGTFILIIALKAGHGLTSFTQEFNSQEACESARAAIFKSIEPMLITSVVFHGCFHKGRN